MFGYFEEPNQNDHYCCEAWLINTWPGLVACAQYHPLFSYLGCKYVCMYVCLADFLKTNLTKFAVIWVKRHQKACFLSLRSSKITVKKEKERRKRKSEEKKRKKREKHNYGLCTLSFCNSYFSDTFWPKKLLDAKGPFCNNVIKNPARRSWEMSSIDAKWCVHFEMANFKRLAEFFGNI